MLDHLPAFLPVSPRLLTAGQPAPADFAQLAQNGVEVVINLAPPGAHGYLADEAQLALENGMIYAHLPILFQQPLVCDFASFAGVMHAHRARVVLVHCAANVRVSALVYLYQTLVEGEDESLARARLLQIWSPDATWSRFIQDVRAAFANQNR